MKEDEWVFMQVPLGEGYATIIFSNLKPTQRDIRHLIEHLILINRHMAERRAVLPPREASIDDIVEESNRTISDGGTEEDNSITEQTKGESSCSERHDT